MDTYTFYRKSLAGTRVCLAYSQTTFRRMCAISVQLCNGSSLHLVNVYSPTGDGILLLEKKTSYLY